MSRAAATVSSLAKYRKDRKFLHSIKDKLKNHHKYAKAEDNELTEKAKELASEDKLYHCFSHLIEEGETWVIQDSAGSEHFGSAEAQEAKEREQMCYDCLVSLTLTVCLQDIESGNRNVVTIANFLDGEHSGKHAAILINDVLLEWGKESLVIPQRVSKEETFIFDDHIDKTGDYFNQLASTRPKQEDIPKEVQILGHAVEVKRKVINRIIATIQRFNSLYYFHPIHRNSQQFVREIINAAKIEKPKCPPDHDSNLQKSRVQPSSKEHSTPLPIKGEGLPRLQPSNSLPSLAFSMAALSEPLQDSAPVQRTHDTQDIDVHDTTSSGSESDDSIPCDGTHSKHRHSSHHSRHSLNQSQYKFIGYRHHSSKRHHRHSRKDRDNNRDGRRSSSVGSALWVDDQDLSIVHFRKVNGFDTDMAIVVMKSSYPYRKLKKYYKREGWKSEGLPQDGFCFSSEYSVFIRHVSQYHYSDIGKNWKWMATFNPEIPGSVIDTRGHGALKLQYQCTEPNRTNKSYYHGVTLEGLMMTGGCRARVNYRLYWEGDVDSSSNPVTPLAITIKDFYFGRDSPLPHHVMIVKNGKDEPFKLTKRLATKWKDIGGVLGLTGDQITSIERDVRKDSEEDRLREVLQHWFDNAPSLKDPDPYPYTWKGLYEMLKDCGCKQIATDYFRYLESIPTP